jgi:hypothetical protein
MSFGFMMSTVNRQRRFHRGPSPPAMTADRLGNLDAEKNDGDVKAALEDHRSAKSFADRHV